MSVTSVQGSYPSLNRSGSGRLVFSLLLLCALLYNSFIFQTHLHPLALPVAAGGADRHVASAIVGEECALCMAAATLEPILPTASDVLVPPPVVAAAPIFGVRDYPFLPSRAHIWRSRAPPGPDALS